MLTMQERQDLRLLELQIDAEPHPSGDKPASRGNRDKRALEHGDRSVGSLSVYLMRRCAFVGCERLLGGRLRRDTGSALIVT